MNFDELKQFCDDVNITKIAYAFKIDDSKDDSKLSNDQFNQLIDHIWDKHQGKGLALIFKVWCILKNKIEAKTVDADFKISSKHVIVNEYLKGWGSSELANGSFIHPTWAHIAAAMGDVAFKIHDDDLNTEMRNGSGTTQTPIKPIHLAYLFGQTKWIEKHKLKNKPFTIQNPRLLKAIFPELLSSVSAMKELSSESLLINAVINGFLNIDGFKYHYDLAGLNDEFIFLCGGEVVNRSQYTSLLQNSHVKLLLYLFLTQDAQKKYKEIIFYEPKLNWRARFSSEGTRESVQTNWGKFVSYFALDSADDPYVKLTLDWVRHHVLHKSDLDIESLEALNKFALARMSKGSKDDIKGLVQGIVSLLKTEKYKDLLGSAEQSEPQVIRFKTLIAEVHCIASRFSIELPPKLLKMFNTYEDACLYSRTPNRLASLWLKYNLKSAHVSDEDLQKYDVYDLLIAKKQWTLLGLFKSFWARLRGHKSMFDELFGRLLNVDEGSIELANRLESYKSLKSGLQVKENITTHSLLALTQPKAEEKCLLVLMNDLNDLVQSGYSELKDVKTYNDILKANSIGMRDELSGLLDKSKMYSELLQYLLKSDGKSKFNSYMQAVKAFEKGVGPENIEKAWKDFIESITKVTKVTKVPQSFRVCLDESFELLNEKVKKCKDEKERYESSLADYRKQKYLFDMGTKDLAGVNKDFWLEFKGIGGGLPQVKHVLKIFDLIDGLKGCKSKEQIKEHLEILRKDHDFDIHIKKFPASNCIELKRVVRLYFKIKSDDIDNYKDQLKKVYLDLQQLLVNSIKLALPKDEPNRPVQAVLEEGQGWKEEVSQLLQVMRLQFNQEELSRLAGEIESFEFKPCSKVLMDCFLDLKAAENQKEQSPAIVSKKHIEGLLDKLDEEIKSCNDQLKGSYEWMKFRKGEGDFDLNSVQQSLFIDGLLNIDKMSESIFSVFLKSKAFDSCSSKSFDDICKYIDRPDITKAQKIRMQEVLVLVDSPDKLIDDQYLLSVEELNRLESKSSERFKPTLNRIFDHYSEYMSNGGVAESNFKKAVMAYPSQWVCYLLTKYNSGSSDGMFSDILNLECSYLSPFKLNLNDIEVLGGGLSADDRVSSYKNMQKKDKDKAVALRGFLLKDVLGSGLGASKEFKQKVVSSNYGFDDFYRLSKFSRVYTRLKAVVFLAAHYPKKSLQECFKKIKSPKQMSWSDVPMFILSLWTNLSVRAFSAIAILSSCALVIFNLASLFAVSVGAGSLLLCKLSVNKLMSIDDGVLTISVGSSRAVKWLSGAAKEAYNKAVKTYTFIKSYSFDPVYNLLPIKFKSNPRSSVSVKSTAKKCKNSQPVSSSPPVNRDGLTVS